MLEIEMKFPVADFTATEQALKKCGAEASSPRDEVDHYFNAPHRDFAQTDEALRIRRIGLASRLTYKGPRRPGPDKTRLEIEVPLGEGEPPATELAQVLTLLGFRPVAIVSKRRRGFNLRRAGFDLEVCLDDVADVGRFVEIEIMALQEALEQARQVLQELARELNLQGSERRSYLEMLLERRKS